LSLSRLSSLSAPLFPQRRIFFAIAAKQLSRSAGIQPQSPGNALKKPFLAAFRWF